MASFYFAHGKLLLTAEYFILDGAKAIALPTKQGQKMEVIDHGDEDILYWKSYNYQGELWLDGVWSVSEMKWIEINDEAKATYIQLLFQYATKELGVQLSGHSVKTLLDFPNEWGLGSSSTLISLLSQWWKVDPYILLQQSFRGSGYDIACASASGPILYHIKGRQPQVEEIDFCPPFRNQIAFLFLGNKQNSREGIQHYRSLSIEKERWVKEINIITESLLNCSHLGQFEELLLKHEAIVSESLQLKRAQEKYFSDYKGVVKSLGAWGGDFVLVTHDGDFQSAQSYFANLGFPTLLTYNEIIL